MVQVGTGELCKAMGRPAGASMEQVKAFVCRLLPLLEAEGLSAACGCGFLALQVVPFSVLETALADERELVTFAPPDIDAYLEKAESSGLSPRSDISPTT